jgi:hypothetical protein
MAGVVHNAISTHILQRGINDCAVAAVAMVANAHYEDVAERSPVKIGLRGLFPREVHQLLVATTGVPWHRPRYGWLRPIAYLATSTNPVVAIIRRPWKLTVLHCVLVQDNWIYDPEFPIRLDAESYPRRHWRTIRTIRPESIVRLLFVQHFRS